MITPQQTAWDLEQQLDRLLQAMAYVLLQRQLRSRGRARKTRGVSL